MELIGYTGKIAGMPSDLSNSMFSDRATQFGVRLLSKVKIDENGFEKDQYDSLDPVYVVVADDNLQHKASMRLLKMSGRTMFVEEFGNILPRDFSPGENDVEFSRFCTSPNSTKEEITLARTKLMQLCLLFGLDQEIEHAYGVFSPPMYKIFKELGWEPEILTERSNKKSTYKLGKWKLIPRIANQLSS